MAGVIKPTSRFSPLRGSILLWLLLPAAYPVTASAVQWETIARTGRQVVSIDSSSVRLTPLSRLSAWLRFAPVSEAQRKLLAAEYGQKSYRLHLEYYEIDCSEQNAVLGMVYVLGPENKRLSRTKGGTAPDPIIPGSVLDMVARKICPVLEDETVGDDEPHDSDDAVAGEESAQTPDPGESRQIIDTALQKTIDTPRDPEAWRELGNAYFDADMADQSIAAYDRALALKPGDPDILNDQGAMYRQKGDFSRALANFEKVRQKDPLNLESLYNSGFVLAFDLRQPEKAAAVWRRYLALDAASETARQIRGFMERINIPVPGTAQK